MLTHAPLDGRRISGKKPSGRDAQRRRGYGAQGAVIRLLHKSRPEAVLTGASRRWTASSRCEPGGALRMELLDKGAGIIARTRAAEV